MSDVTVSDAVALLDLGALLLDVREPEEWDAGHVPGATFIPMGLVPARLAELPTDRPIVVLCRAGHRSAAVTEGLRGAGFEAVNLEGGLLAWEAEHRQVVTEAGATGIVI